MPAILRRMSSYVRQLWLLGILGGFCAIGSAAACGPDSAAANDDSSLNGGPRDGDGDAAAADADAATPDADLDFAACAAQHVAPNADGDRVIQCDQPFAAAPRVHLPADDTAGAVATLYAAIDGQETAVLRDGSRLAFMDEAGAVISFHDPTKDRSGSLPAALRMPSNRSMYLVYRLTGTLGQATPLNGGAPVAAIHLASGEPFVMLPGEQIDGAMLGVWEGTTGKRNADGSFTPDQVPLRVRFSTKAPTKSLDAWASNTPLADGPVFELRGEIENYDQAIKASDAKCYAALSSLGTSNPFFGATSGAVTAYRLTGMHTQGDEWLVFTVPQGATDFSVTTMSPLGPFSPKDWIAVGGASELVLKPHGLKGSLIKLHHVDAAAAGDGGGC